MQSARNPNLLTYALVFGVGALLAGFAASWFKGDLTFVDYDAAGAWLTTFWGRFQIMFVLSVLIERSVETYLNVTKQNGEEAVDPQSGSVVKVSDAKKAAMQAALVLSALVALAGVRIIETLVTLDAGAGPFKSAVWHGIDILISAGLMAGGADLFHKVAQLISDGLTRMRSGLRVQAPQAFLSANQSLMEHSLDRNALLASVLVAKTYSIVVVRPAAPAEEGALEFKDGALTINAKCWWDKNNRILANTYLRSSKTYMATLGIEGIYLPDAVSQVTGAKEIFLHRGSSPDNSNGCIAVEEVAFNAIWNQISPLNGRNVTVVVKDV